MKKPRVPLERRAITIDDACHYLSLSRASIYRLFKKGALTRPRMIAGIGRRLDFQDVKALADRTFGEGGEA